MYSIRCKRYRASGSWRKGDGSELSGATDGEKGPLSSRRRGYKRKGPVGAPRTRGERSGKEMRKSVINWRWDYSRRALRRQAARRTTWKVLPDTFRAPPVGPSSLSAGYIVLYLARWAPATRRAPAWVFYGPASSRVANLVKERILLNLLARHTI